MATFGEGYSASSQQTEEEDSFGYSEIHGAAGVALQDPRSRLQARLYPRDSISGREPAARDNDSQHVQSKVSQGTSRTVLDGKRRPHN